MTTAASSGKYLVKLFQLKARARRCNRKRYEIRFPDIELAKPGLPRFAQRKIKRGGSKSQMEEVYKNSEGRCHGVAIPGERVNERKRKKIQDQSGEK
jgi:hypothetical protein